MKSVTELRNEGINAIPAKKGAGSVSFGIKKISALNVYIHTDSKNLQKEWNRYRWAKLANGEYARDSKNNLIPVKQDDDLIDGVRYAVTKLSAWG